MSLTLIIARPFIAFQENTDHRLSLKLNYPVRVIHLDTGYKFKKNTLEWTTAVNLNASRTDDKIVSTMIFTLEPLQNTDRIAGKASVTIKHPKLAQVRVYTYIIHFYNLPIVTIIICNEEWIKYVLTVVIMTSKRSASLSLLC